MWTRREFLKTTAMPAGALAGANASVLLTPDVARAAAIGDRCRSTCTPTSG
jgi:hypothetical protein